MKDEAKTGVQIIERKIHADHQSLTDQAMSQRYTIDYFKREKAQLEKQKNEQNRNLVIENDTAEQYEQRGHQQVRKIQLLKEKILVLEKSLQ